MQEKYNVTGMTCAACQARGQKSVSNLTGVQECNVNLLKNSMVVTYNDKNVNSGQIIAAVEKAGYGASIQQVKGKSAAQAVSSVDTAKKEYETMKRRVIWSFVFTIPLFCISMGHMMGWPLPSFFLGTENSMIYALTLFLLVLPVAIINNKYYRMGFKTLFHGSPNMDSLIALGSGASLAYGVYALYKIAWGFGYGDLAMVNQFTHDLYFEGAGTILTLITLGKFFEARAKGRTSDAINKLMNLAPKKATVVRNGVETVIPAEEVEKGDILIVKAGESVPVDGVLLEGTGSLDESAITGESIPVDKQAGDKVIGATINQSGYFKMRADKVGDETALSQIIRLWTKPPAPKRLSPSWRIKKIQKDLEAKQKELDDLKAETILVIRGVSALDKELLGTLVAEAKDALETLEKQLVQAQEEYEEATKTAKRSNYICNELFTWADVYDTANHDERRAILQQFIKEIRVRKDYEISITLNASFNQVEQLKAVSTYDGAEIFEEISEKGA